METEVLHHSGGGMRGTLIAVGLHAAAPVVWLGIFVFVVPRFAGVIGDLTDGSQALPRAAQWVFNASSFFLARWYAYPMLLAPLLLVDGAIHLGLGARGGRTAARTWSMLVLLGEAAITLLILVGMYLPLVGALERLT